MKDPRWRVCYRCMTVREGRYTSVPEGWRVIRPGEIHHGGTCEVFPDLATYRAAIGAYSGSYDPREVE